MSNPNEVPELTDVEPNGLKKSKSKKSKPKAKAQPNKKITCKYIKKDKFNNGIFVVSEDSKYLKESFNLAKIYYKKLRTKFETNLPIYIKKKDGFGTLRFKKGEMLSKLKEHAIYEIEFKFCQTSNNKNEKFVNLNIINIDKISDFDNGLELEISDVDDGAESSVSESESESEE